MDMETLEPTNRLTNACIAWCRKVGSTAETVQDIVNKKDVAVIRAIQVGQPSQLGCDNGGL